MAFTPTGLGWSSPSGNYDPIQEGVNQVQGRLISNGKEVEGEENAQLAGKGLIYENAYGEGLVNSSESRACWASTIEGAKYPRPMPD